MRVFWFVILCFVLLQSEQVISSVDAQAILPSVRATPAPADFTSSTSAFGFVFDGAPVTLGDTGNDVDPNLAYENASIALNRGAAGSAYSSSQAEAVCQSPAGVDDFVPQLDLTGSSSRSSTGTGFAGYTCSSAGTALFTVAANPDEPSVTSGTLYGSIYLVGNTAMDNNGALTATITNMGVGPSGRSSTITATRVTNGWSITGTLYDASTASFVPVAQTITGNLNHYFVFTEPVSIGTNITITVTGGFAHTGTAPESLGYSASAYYYVGN